MITRIPVMDGVGRLADLSNLYNGSEGFALHGSSRDHAQERGISLVNGKSNHSSGCWPAR